MKRRDLFKAYTITSFIRGHEIVWSPKLKEWLYVDTKETYENDRKCIKCGKMPTSEGHDACLGELPGIEFACCGHGITKGYRSEK